MITSSINPLPLYQYQNSAIKKQSKFPVNTNASQDIFSFPKQSPKSQNLKFGLDPMTWMGLTTAAHFYKKGIDWAISNTVSNPSSEVLENSSNYKNGITYLGLANAVNDEDKLVYIKKAEEKFIEASNDFNVKLFQAECFKYAAVCAKIRKADESTVDHLAIKSYNLYVTFYNEEIRGKTVPLSLSEKFEDTDIPEVTRKLYVGERTFFRDTFMERAPGPIKRHEGCIVQ